MTRRTSLSSRRSNRLGSSPGTFGRDWRRVREKLGLPEVTTHSFRKSVATLIDDRGLSARIGADQLGHARPSMTQDRYMARGKVHTEAAEALDDAINGPKRPVGQTGATENTL